MVYNQLNSKYVRLETGEGNVDVQEWDWHERSSETADGTSEIGR